jgi:hypothetical protein
MPRFDQELLWHTQSAAGIGKAGEIAHTTGDRVIRGEWTIRRLEALYELAYLRVFAAWESYLEAVFYRSLCVYASSAGQETLHSGHYFPTLLAAQTAVSGASRFLLWHNPRSVIQRCQTYIRSGGPGCPALQETTLSSKVSDLVHLAAVRHRIVHDQEDAKRNFDAATVSIVGRTYPGSRPGKFLRDRNTSAIPYRRWFDVLAGDLVALMRQMV